MSEFAVFSESIAQELESKGFALLGRSALAWFFEDSAELEAAIEEALRLRVR
jgi:hypothetical protein